MKFDLLQGHATLAINKRLEDGKIIFSSTYKRYDKNNKLVEEITRDTMKMFYDHKDIDPIEAQFYGVRCLKLNS
jgi:hypothetical protein